MKAKIKRGLLYFLTAVFSVQIAVSASAKAVDPFDPPAVKAKLLQIKMDRTLPEYIVDPPPPAGSKQEKLLEFFFKEIKPRQDEMTWLNRITQANSQLIDSGLYDESLGENKAWSADSKKAMDYWSAFETDPEWKKKIKEFGRLAQGLDGEFAKSVREEADTLEEEGFPETARPLLAELYNLVGEINSVANTSTFKEEISRLAPQGAEILLKFFAGEIPFKTAAVDLEKIETEGTLAYGQDVAFRAMKYLNRAAVLRSQLAKIKGLKTWADFQLSTQARNHSAEFQSKEKLLEFLRGLLKATDAVTRRYVEMRAQDVAGRPYSELSTSEMGLLSQPTNLLVREYFPKEKFLDIWRKSMLESGFDKKIVDSIIVDAFPRRNKAGHAYLRPIIRRHLNEVKINGQTLNVELPAFESPKWTPAVTYILQNFQDDGLPALSTAFHEGGHALDYNHQMDNIGSSSAYGYVETHSIAMEHFLMDREFLLANGKTRYGKKLTSEIVDTFLKRKAVQNLMSFRTQVANAIFDIELWNYDYDQVGADTFTEHMRKIDEEVNQLAHFNVTPKTKGPHTSYFRFTTSHYYSGEVRYFGYVLADVSAELVVDSLYRKLKLKTGRESLYQQPELANMLVKGLYQRGFVEPFPNSIEKFTEQKFSPDEFAKGLVSRVETYLKELENSKASICEAVFSTRPTRK